MRRGSWCEPQMVAIAGLLYYLMWRRERLFSSAVTESNVHPLCTVDSVILVLFFVVYCHPARHTRKGLQGACQALFPVS